MMLRMTAERREPEISSHDAKIEIEAHIGGIMSEVGKEIAEVEKWTSSVRIGPVIMRKEQQLIALGRLMEELEGIGRYISSVFGQTKPSDTQKKPEE